MVCGDVLFHVRVVVVVVILVSVFNYIFLVNFFISCVKKTKTDKIEKKKTEKTRIHYDMSTACLDFEITSAVPDNDKNIFLLCSILFWTYFRTTYVIGAI